MHLEAGQQENGLDQLVARIDALEARVRLLERGAPLRHPAAEKSPLAAVPLAGPQVEPEKDLALLGRSLIGIGGAFLLRALTESALLPQLAGVLLGVLYAFAWMWLADRQARRGEWHGATFSAAVAAIIVFPLTWEVSIRFELIPPALALVLLLAASGTFFSIAWTRRLAGAAWIAAIAAPPCAALLAVGSLRASVPLIAAALIAAGAWWTARERGWGGIGWPPALTLAAMGGVAAIVAATEGGHDSPELVALALCGALLIYAGAIGARPLARGADLNGFDLAAAAPAVIVMVIGSSYLASLHSAVRPAVPLLLGCAAAFGYAVAMKHETDAMPVARTAFASIGIACAVASSSIVLSPAGAGILWALFGAAGAIVGSGILLHHGTAYAVAAVVASGLLGRAFSVVSGIGGAKALTLVDGFIIVIVTASSVAAMLRGTGTRSTYESAARITLLAVSTFLVCAGVAAVFVAAAAATGPMGATARSAAIACVAVALVFVARLRPLADVSLLVYPLLCVGAAKFVTDDFIGGRAATLFVTLAIYGVALLVVARYRRSGRVISV